MEFLDIAFLVLVILFLIQGVTNIVLSLYAWEVPERLAKLKSPRKFKDPKMTFSVLLPARNEKDVIGETLLCVFNANYPKEFFEMILICQEDDIETIAAANESIYKNGIFNAKIVTFNDFPINKPHGLNKGLKFCTNESLVIFDSEDSVHPDLFNIANTLFQTKKADVIQSGIQLMNFDTKWFCSHNVVEYYFWFRSRMHFNTKIGVVTLGGNSVFFKTQQLRDVGGWDETILAEDGEIGIRLSVRGKKIISTYDPRHVTQEETPLTVDDFIKQRTRWNQGFMQILAKKEWVKYDTLRKKIFCLYTLAFPYIQTFLFFITIISIAFGIKYKIPIVLSWISFVPLLVLCAQIIVNCIGLHEFTHEQHLKLKKRTIVLMALTFIPYQLLLSIGAVRATYRQAKGRSNWEKTSHTGQHRFEPAISAIEKTVSTS